MDIKQEVNQAIVNFLIKTIKEPLISFSEADLQQMLVEELHKIKVLSKLYPTSVKRGQNSKSVYSTSLIHREYGAGDKSRIDVVIFDKEHVREINDINLTKGKEYLPPLYAFELGTEKSPDTKNHFQNDFKKLGNCIKNGYLIHVYKDTTASKSGTGRRENTEKKIEAKFKSIFNKSKPDSKIKVLAMLLRVYRKQSKIIGKCEIYTHCQESWKKISINGKEKIKEAILGELS